MSRYSRQSFFYQQRKRSVGTRREKKPVDTQPLFCERREAVLTFRPGAGGEGEEGLGNIRLRAKSAALHRQRRPSSAASRKSSVWFPPIDPSGPHLTTTQVPLDEPLITEEEEETAKQPNYKFNEIKFASTSILSNLNRRLELVTSSVSELQLPESLVNLLILSFHQLVVDTIVEKREWQTDCYRDYKPSTKKLFLTGEPPDGDPIRGRLEASLNRLAKQQLEDKRKGKKQKERMSEQKKKIPERPLTAKSTMSGISLKSDFSNVSDADSRADYDKLPPELRTQGPEILRHRRESKAPKPKLIGPRTRLEKFNRMRKKEDTGDLKEKKKIATILLQSKSIEGKPSEDADNESNRPMMRVLTTSINFSMASKECADQGWIVHPSKTSDPEGFTLYQWANTKLQEAMRQREESYLTAKLRGEDGPLVVKYYSDSTYYRPFKGARQRAASFPLPNILSKLPPSVGTFSSHSQNEVFLSSGEGLILCLLLLPDGSGFCNYYSGRRAVSLSRKGDGSRGLYTVVFDDNDYNNMIAYFMPDGRIACYHRNGGLHLLTDVEGGLLMDEDGCTTRQWSWPKNGERISHSVSIQLNTHLALQCTGLYQMTLKFSCHGQMHRFPVGLRPEFIDSEHGNEAFWMKRSSIISSRLQCKLPFQSDTAKKIWHHGGAKDEDTFQQQSGPSTKPQSREALVSRESRLRQLEDSSLNDSVSGSLSKWNEEPSRKELGHYKTKIRTIVEEWLNHYRQAIGISPPSRPSLQSSCSNIRLMSSHCLKGHSSSRPPSRFLSSSPVSLPHTPAASRPATPIDIRDESFVHSRVISPLEQLIQRPKSQESSRPFKVGPAKSKPRPPIRFRPGCPIALHKMIVYNLHEMPQCRCDKRRISVIRDVEFDVFLNCHVPSDQLVIIICVTRIGKVLPCQPLLESLHEKQNANRYAPCQQSGRDVFRILKYNLHSSMDDLNTTEPLLSSRHNISDGMFLMYMNGKLIGASTGFNGYGITEKDFLKQIQRSLENGRNGQYLPQDFKLSKASVKLHSNSLWAYPVSGVLDEMISCTPSSNQSVSPTTSATNGWNVKLDESRHTGFSTASGMRENVDSLGSEASGMMWSRTSLRRED